MSYTSPAHHRSLDEFRAHWREVAPELGASEAASGRGCALMQPLAHPSGLSVPNRFAIHPMEGWDGTHDGRPSADTLRRWRRFGRSGAGMIWGGEAFAVSHDGRANPNQLYQNDELDSHAELVRLLAEVVQGAQEVGASRPLVGLQLTHSGRWARPSAAGPAARIAVHHAVLDARLGLAPDAELVADDELAEIAARYVSAARLAQAAGFDFVDVKCCHGYLMHELLGARSRPGRYGGSFENRTRLFREIVAGIREACPGLEVGARVSIGDVFPHEPEAETRVGTPRGWDEQLPLVDGFGIDADAPRQMQLAEPMRFLGLCKELGVHWINLTLSSPYYAPHLQRPATCPPSDGYQPPVDPLASVAEHLRATRAVRAAHPELVLVGTGYSYLQEWLVNVAEHEVGQGHVDLVGLGRMVLSYPELPLDVAHGRALQRRLICRTFSDCTTAPRNGLPSGCFPLDPHYRSRPERAQLEAIKRGRRD